MSARLAQALSYGYNRVSGTYRSVESFCLRQKNAFGSCARTMKAVSNVAVNVLTRQKDTATLSSLQAIGSNFVVLAYKSILGKRIDILIESLGALVLLRTVQNKPGNDPAMEDFVLKEQAKSFLGLPIHFLSEAFPGTQLSGALTLSIPDKYPLAKETGNAWFDLCANNVTFLACGGGFFGFVLSPIATAGVSIFRKEYQDSGSFRGLFSNLAQAFRNEKLALESSLPA